MSVSDHESSAKEQTSTKPVGCAILTISDTRTVETDKGGPLAGQLLIEAGHRVIDQRLVKDEPQSINDQITKWIKDSQVNAIITTGGTGIANRDITIEAIRNIFTTELEGFGEIFRMLSYQEIGSAAMLSRAIGGLVAGNADSGGDTFIFAIPGSPAAVKLAVEKLIAPQLGHLVWQRLPVVKAHDADVHIAN